MSSSATQMSKQKKMRQSVTQEDLLPNALEIVDTDNTTVLHFDQRMATFCTKL